MTDRRIIWIWLSEFGRPVYRTYENLLTVFGDIEKIWDADSPGKMPDLIAKDKKLCEKLTDRSLRERAKRILDRVYNDKGRITTLESADYPDMLKQIYSPPLVLYYYGCLPDVKRKSMPLLSVVGSRRSTIYGENSVYKICAQLAYCGVGIVSGMARGIDARAHEGAIAGGGYTAAVLGGGANIIYPYENIYLYHKIREYGCVLSEYPPDTEPLRNHFPARNRIIAGMSGGVFVCEAAKSSGTMITVTQAIEAGREIFALPGNIDNYNSEGTNNLIKSGAVCVTEYTDILEAMGMKLPARKDAVLYSKLTELEGNNKTVAQAIAEGAETIEQLKEKCRLTVANIQTALTILEVKGIIHRNRWGGYALS